MRWVMAVMGGVVIVALGATIAAWGDNAATIAQQAVSTSQGSAGKE